MRLVSITESRVGMDAVERLQGLKQRRESLIADKAGLSARVKQNKLERSKLQAQLKELGVSEETLDETVAEKQRELKAAEEALEKSLSSEEVKVQEIQEKLGKI